MFVGLPRLLLLLCVTTLPLSPAPSSSQLPRRLERCLPYPTLAHEIRQLQSEAPRPAIRVASVRFAAEGHLSRRIRQQITRTLKQRSFDAGPDWTDDVRDVVQQILIEHGYFRPDLKIQTHPLRSGPSSQVVLIAGEGSQYWLESIRIEGSKVFPSQELRALFPLRRGELFNVVKVRKGFDAVSFLYGTKGYIDATAEANTNLDDFHRRVSLVVRIDEGPQYRVNGIEILGLNRVMTEQLLKSLPKSGQLFDRRVIEDFLKQNQSLLPNDASPKDMAVSRDVQNATVDLVFDFRSCPQE